LELDQRCVEIAAFAVALEAWRYPDASGYRLLPSLNIAWVGQSIKAKKEDWLSLAGDDEHLYFEMEALYNTFKDAPLLGSLIDPGKLIAKDLLSDGFADLQPLLNKALQQFEVVENQEAAIAAKGLTLASDLLSKKYNWVITNVPYLGRGKQAPILMDFCEKYYSDAKSDLATVFLARCLELCLVGGTTSIVLPQNWLFLSSYKKFRMELLNNDTWHLIARLGAGAFETISGEVVKAILITMTRGNILSGERFNTNVPAGMICGVDVSEPRTVTEKAKKLIVGEIKQAKQNTQLENPDARIMLEDLSRDGELLSKEATAYQGLITGDRNSFIFSFWEISRFSDEWQYFLDGFSGEGIPLGREQVILWEHANGRLYKFAKLNRDRLHDMHESGNLNWKRKGVALTRIGLRVTPYYGEKFDNNLITIVTNDPKKLDALWSYCSSGEYKEGIKALDQKLSLTNATACKVSVNLEHWEDKDKLPQPYSDDPTQWLFHGHPAKAEAPLQVAVARLLGYQWPAESDKEMELSDQARAWLAQCECLASFVDDDGIVCLSPVRGEKAADERLEALLMAAFGEQRNASHRNKLLTDVQCSGKTLGFWLREKFFEQHCKLFQNRPFIWHIWDGLPDGFNALLNYHQLDRQNLERLIYTYLGDWIRTQDHGVKEGIDGAILRLQAAQILKTRLETILEGEAPYDIFVRWKSLAEQPLGWNPDINDGVRMNIRPFMSVPDVGKKEAGILRTKPNIKWTKDRGNDVASAPWYSLGLDPKYNESEGSRINDHHLSLAEKKAARDE